MFSGLNVKKGSVRFVDSWLCYGTIWFAYCLWMWITKGFACLVDVRILHRFGYVCRLLLVRLIRLWLYIEWL